MNFIISLQKKKVRKEERLYVIEGVKLIKEFLAADISLKTLVALPEFLNSLPAERKQEIPEIIPVSYDELKKISSLKTPHNALAVVQMVDKRPDPASLKKEVSAALDFIQDPGNLGTIIRAAAWFGIKNIYCSGNCVDVYNPKVIQATMGAILHVNMFYTDLRSLFEEAAGEKIRIFGAVLDGEALYSASLGKPAIIFLGNESKGISEELLPFITDRITIPRYCDTGPGIDSLNVGVAASVIFSEFARRSLPKVSEGKKLMR
ncbi:MAG: RNA methyltransferase [Bacteroidales bacterium]|nr:RNA methyltransferase [Bacteroidales bacterium]